MVSEFVLHFKVAVVRVTTTDVEVVNDHTIKKRTKRNKQKRPLIIHKAFLAKKKQSE